MSIVYILIFLMYPTGGKWGKQIKEATFKKADTSRSIVIIKLYAGIVCSTTTTKKQN